MIKFIFVTFFGLLLGQCAGHTFHSGECPKVDPVQGFEPKQFLGVWYAIQKTATSTSCIIYNITLGEEPGEYQIEQFSQNVFKSQISYTGTLSIADEDVPAKMKVKFPLNIAGESSFIVFMTDYESYAGIFTCQKIGFTHRKSATLLSRSRTIEKMYLDKMRTRLATYNVDPFDLSIISQKNCPKTGEENPGIHITPETFSASNIANAFRKAGDKIGDGVEWTIEAGKKAFQKLMDNNSDENGEKHDEASRYSAKPIEDTEWISF